MKLELFKKTAEVAIDRGLRLAEENEKLNEQLLNCELKAQSRMEALASSERARANMIARHAEMQTENEKLNEQVRRLRASLGKLIDEVTFVISGGDNPSDKCSECGCAGIGMMRDARTDSIALLKETAE